MIKFSLKRNSIISFLATLSYSITATHVFISYPLICRCVWRLDGGRCWHTANGLKCLKVYQLSAWNQVQGITYCPGRNSFSPSQCCVGGKYSAKWHQHFWSAITSKDLASQGISSSETSVDFHISITIWCGCMSFLVVYATFSEGDCFLRQCFWFTSFSREAGSDNPIKAACV